MACSYDEELKLLVDKVEGNNEYTWAELADKFMLNIHPDTLRKSFNGTVFSGYNVFKHMQNKSFEELNSIEKEEIKNSIKQLQIEREKTRTENLEYRNNIRTTARNELFYEQILHAIENMEPMSVCEWFNVPEFKNCNENIGFLAISDAHYGKEFELKGLHNGEIVNSYSPNIFKIRMKKLMADVINDYYEMGYSKLIIADCGDAIEGILRANSQLQKLQYGVIDSALQYAEFISQWLNELSIELSIPIEYSIVGGNHDIVRILNSKPDFPDENVAKVIREFIYLRLKDNNKIIIHEYSDVVYHNIYDLTILTYHGEDKDLKTVIEFFENYFEISIDILICGHLHRSSSESIGYGIVGDREIIRLPSLCGIDEFSKRIRKSARAGAKFMLFNKDGKSWEKVYYLN